MIFNKQCFCQKTNETFRTDYDDENVLDVVFCPDCVDRSGANTVLVDITGVPGRTGLWGLKFNDVVIKKFDENFTVSDENFIKIFDSQYCTFDFIPQRTPRMFYRINSVRQGDDVKQKSSLTGKDLNKSEKPTQLPGKTKAGAKESGKKKEGK